MNIGVQNLFLQKIILVILVSFGMAINDAAAQTSGQGGGGVPYGFEIEQSFDVLNVEYLGDNKVKVTYALLDAYDRGEVPFVRVSQGPLGENTFELTGLGIGIHDVTIDVGNDVGIFDLYFFWYHKQPIEPYDGGATYSFTIIDGEADFVPGELFGISSSPIGGTYGDSVDDDCSRPSAIRPIGANHCNGEIANKNYPTISMISLDGSGCGSCGGADASVAMSANELDYRIYFQPENGILNGRFGRGIFTLYDNGGLAVQTPGENPSCRIFDVRLGKLVTFLDDEYGTSAGDGILKDRMGYFKEARLIGGNSLASSTGIEVIQHNGEKFVYEYWERPDDDDDLLDRDLRLKKIVNRNSKEILVTYPDGNSGHYDSVADWKGNTISVGGYQPGGGNQSAGSMTINGQTFTCTFGNDGFLSGITGPDGWFITIDVSTNPVSQTTEFKFTDHINGERTYHGALDYMVYNEEIISQPSAFLRGIFDADDNNIVTIFHDTATPGMSRLLYGDDMLVERNIGEWAIYHESWNSSNPGQFTELVAETASCANIFTGVLPYGSGVDLEAMKMLGAAPRGVDMWGDTFDYEYDSDYAIHRKHFEDGTYEEYTRNEFKQPIRYIDRLGNVTRYDYDTAGNLLKRRVGIVDKSGEDDNDPDDYAEYVFDYNACGQIWHKYDPRYNSAFPDMFVTEYVYDSNNRLWKIIEAADVSGGHRPTTIYTYHAGGLVHTVTRPGHSAGQTRTTTYQYNGFGARTQATYHDGSTEKWIYGAAGTPDSGRLVKYKDRMGVVTSYEYDDFGRQEKVTVNAEHMASDGTITPVTDISQQLVTINTYRPGTQLVTSSTTNGRKTDYSYDYRRRVIETKTYPCKLAGVQQAHTNRTVYRNNRVFYTEDHNGFRSYMGYSATNQTELIRRVQVTETNFTLDDNADILALDVTTDPINGRFIIADAIKDAEGNVVKTIDGRGIETVYEFNTRNLLEKRTDAFGTSQAVTTVTVFGAAGSPKEIRSPRNQDSSDPESGNMFRRMYYNGRGLPSKTTVGTAEQILNETTYGPDGRVASSKDAAGELWYTFYHNCCGRLLGNKDPLGHGSLSNTDRAGRVTHTAIVENYDSHSNSHDPDDNLTHGEATTRYDGLGRVIARTQWLQKRGTVDSENPPIAGWGGVSSSEGLTSRMFYDNNLSDGIGLDSSSGITVNKLAGGTYNLNITQCLAKLAEATSSGGAEMEFTSISPGSAVVSINAEEEISVSISDASGRNVMTAQLEPHDGANPFSIITHRCMQYGTATIDDFGGAQGTLSETIHIDAAGNLTKSHVDGAGRTLQTVDAAGNVTKFEYDANSNMLKSRDPNEVGFDVVYDNLNRATSRTSTHGESTSTIYDHEGNAVQQIDAKNKTTYITYDNQNRRKTVTDRINGVTTYVYLPGGQLGSIMDAEGKTTSYEYNQRGEKVKEIHPDHTNGSNYNDPGYGIVEYNYDPAGRNFQMIDQEGRKQTRIYDLAGRMTQRDFASELPGGPTAPSDTFTYDDAGRVLVAFSGPYNNTLTRTYDEAGRMKTEKFKVGTKNYLVSYEYNNLGQISKLTYPDSTTVERTYNSRRLLETIKYTESTRFPSGKILDTRGYDDGGRQVSSTFGNTTSTTFTYRNSSNSSGNDNHLYQIATTNVGGNKVGTYTYAYDANGNKTAETITGAGAFNNFGFSTPTSGYDDEDRLVAWNRADGVNHTWNLSLVGDWNSYNDGTGAVNRTHNDVHEITGIGGVTVEHDVRGNVTKNATGQTFTWDWDNRLVTTDKDGDGTDDYEAQYDAFGRRVAWGTIGAPRTWIYAGQQGIARYIQNGTNPLNRYVYGSYIDEPIFLDRRVGANWLGYYYHRNQQYSITALTDEAGKVSERYAYDAYGNTRVFAPNGTTEWTASKRTNSFAYTGREYAFAMKQYYFRARWYSPSDGRFMNRDPLRFVDGMSLYRGYFAPGSVDPFGLDDRFPHRKHIRFDQRKFVRFQDGFSHNGAKPTYIWKNNECLAVFVFDHWQQYQTKTETWDIFNYTDPNALNNIANQIANAQNQLGKLQNDLANKEAYCMVLQATAVALALDAGVHCTWCAITKHPVHCFLCASVALASAAAQVAAMNCGWQANGISGEISDLQQKINDLNLQFATGQGLPKLIGEELVVSQQFPWSGFKKTGRTRNVSRKVSNLYCLCPGITERLMGVPTAPPNWINTPSKWANK